MNIYVNEYSESKGKWLARKEGFLNLWVGPAGVGNPPGAVKGDLVILAAE